MNPRSCVLQDGISDAEYLTDPSGTLGVSQSKSPSPTPSALFSPEPEPESHTNEPPHNPQLRHPTLPLSPLKFQGKRKREIADSDGEDSREGIYAAWGDGVELDSIQQTVSFGEGGLGGLGGGGDGDGGGYEEG